MDYITWNSSAVICLIYPFVDVYIMGLVTIGDNIVLLFQLMTISSILVGIWNKYPFPDRFQTPKMALSCWVEWTVSWFRKQKATRFLSTTPWFSSHFCNIEYENICTLLSALQIKQEIPLYNYNKWDINVFIYIPGVR